jgi:hypothetical protein
LVAALHRHNLHAQLPRLPFNSSSPYEKCGLAVCLYYITQWVNNRWLSGRTESECEWLVNQRQRLIEASCSSACKSSYLLRPDLRWLFPAARKRWRRDRLITLEVEVWQLHLSRLGPMATSTTPQPYTADRPENSTTSVDASVGLPLHRSLARWMFSRSALISSHRNRVYVLLFGSKISPFAASSSSAFFREMAR